MATIWALWKAKYLQQFPQFRVIAVDPKDYSGSRKEFAAKINASKNFCGWETTQDNLRTNPAKYA